MMPPPPPGMGGRNIEKWKDPKPKSLREVPGYLKKVFGGTFRRLFYVFGIVWNTAHWILFFLLFMMLYNGLAPVAGSFIGAALLNALAEAIKTGTLDDFYPILFLQFGYLIVNSVVNNVHTILNRIAGERVTNNIKLRIVNKAKEVDLASFDRPEFYERLENANREAGNRPIQILNSTFSIISALISVIIYIAVLGAILPYAPVLVIVVSIPSAVVNFIYRRKNFEYMRRRSVDRRQMSYFSDLLVNKDMVKEIRLFGLSDRFIDGYRRVFEKYFQGLKKLIYAEGFWNIFFMLLSTGLNCALYIGIAKSVVTGAGQIGDFSLYTGALNAIASGVAGLISTTATIYEGSLFIDNLLAFMNEKRTIRPLSLTEAAENAADDSFEGLPVNRHSGHTVVFDHVCFRYAGSDHDVLHDVCLTLNPGDTCVLVGLNGAGKTTLIKLLTRLYDPTSGTIYLDGQDIRTYNVEALYKMFGIIFQDFGKYAFSVTDNIAFGDIERELDMRRVRDAAVQADADVFIDRLPKKFDTPLMRFFSEEGAELSIGQWQKLSVARAFYADSDFLILDEPTASLDAIAEQEIFRQFDELRRDKTTIFVSHRLSSATIANKIIVLENGRVIEQGSHTELMQAKGKYYELFSIQAKRYVMTAEEGLLGDNASIPDGDVHHAGQTPPEGFPPRGRGIPPFPQGEKPPRDGRPPFGKPPFDKPPQGGKPPFGKPPQGDKPPFDKPPEGKE